MYCTACSKVRAESYLSSSYCKLLIFKGEMLIGQSVAPSTRFQNTQERSWDSKGEHCEYLWQGGAGLSLLLV
jgi:hypothetical protein